MSSFLQMILLTVLIAAVFGAVLRFFWRMFGARVPTVTADADPSDRPSYVAPPRPIFQPPARYLVDGDVRQFAALPISDLRRITLSLSSAEVVIKHPEDGSGEGLLELRANFPGRWSVVNGNIEEVEDFEYDPTDERLRVTSADGDMHLRNQPVERSRMRLTDGRLYIDEKRVQLVTADQVLEIIVPVGFNGGLEISNTGGAQVSFDCDWQGDLSLESELGDFSGQSLKVGTLKVNCSDSAACDFGEISAESAEINMADGNFKARALHAAGSAEISFSGTGDLEIGSLSGSVSLNLQEGSNTYVVIGDASGAKLDVVNDGEGKVDITTVASDNVDFAIGGEAGNVTLGEVNCSIFGFDVCGYGDLSVTKLAAAVSATLVSQDGSNSIFTVGELKCASTDITLDGEGDAKIETVGGGSFKGVAGSNGAAFGLGAVDLTGPFDLEQYGNGDTTVQALFSPTVKLYCSDNGSFSVTRLKAAVANLKSEGDYGIRVDRSKIQALYAEALGSGDIDVTGEVGNWKTRESDYASVTVTEAEYGE